MFDPADHLTPKELAQIDVERTAYDAIMCIAKLIKLRNDPVSAAFVAKEIGSLWEIKTQVDLLISEIKETSKPQLKVVS